MYTGATRGVANMQTLTLTGKAALIMGAGRQGNMGHLIAKRLAAEGARVLVAGRDATHLQAIAGELRGGNGHRAISPGARTRSTLLRRRRICSGTLI